MSEESLGDILDKAIRDRAVEKPSIFPSKRRFGQGKDTTTHNFTPEGGEITHDPEPIANVLERIDRNDLSKITDDYIRQLIIEADAAITRLRQRANILRLRAQEMDAEAEDIHSRSDSLHSAAMQMIRVFESADDSLASGAHINPRR